MLREKVRLFDKRKRQRYLIAYLLLYFCLFAIERPFFTRGEIMKVLV